MVYDKSHEGEALILRIGGDLDATSVPDLRPALDELVEGGHHDIVVDLADLRLIDSSGVGALVYLFRQVRARGGTVVMRGAKEQPLAILRLLKLDQILLQAAA